MAAIVAVAEMSLGELDATKNPFVKRIVDRAVEEYFRQGEIAERIKRIKKGPPTSK